MSTYEPDPVKTGSRDEKPARIVLRTGETIDVAHHFVNSDGWVCAYETSKQGGIDLRFPPSAVKWIDTREATISDDSDDVEPEIGDVVTVRDEDRSADPGPWKVEAIHPGGVARLWSAWQEPRREPVEDLNVVEKAEDTIPPVGVIETRGEA